MRRRPHLVATRPGHSSSGYLSDAVAFIPHQRKRCCCGQVSGVCQGAPDRACPALYDRWYRHPPAPRCRAERPQWRRYPYMAQYAYGERIGRTAQLKLGTSAIILDEAGDNILLTRRTDNGRWCLPGGAMDPGESLEECCIREVWEETGLIGFCRKFCSGGHEGAVAPICVALKRRGSRTVRPQYSPLLPPLLPAAVA